MSGQRTQKSEWENVVGSVCRFLMSKAVVQDNSYSLVPLTIADIFSGNSCLSNSLLVHMVAGVQSVNNSHYLNDTWEIHGLVLQDSLSAYHKDNVLQVSELLTHHDVSGDSQSCLDLFDLAGPSCVSLSHADISKGTVMLQRLLSQLATGVLVTICYLIEEDVVHGDYCSYSSVVHPALMWLLLSEIPTVNVEYHKSMRLIVQIQVGDVFSPWDSGTSSVLVRIHWAATFNGTTSHFDQYSHKVIWEWCLIFEAAILKLPCGYCDGTQVDYCVVDGRKGNGEFLVLLQNLDHHVLTTAQFQVCVYRIANVDDRKQHLTQLLAEMHMFDNSGSPYNFLAITVDDKLYGLFLLFKYLFAQMAFGAQLLSGSKSIVITWSYAADESCQNLVDAQTVIEGNLAHVINIKLAKLGVLGGLEVIDAARKANVALMIGDPVYGGYKAFEPLYKFISACGHDGSCEQSLHLFDQMWNGGVEPGVNSWNCVIYGCVQNIQYDEALGISVSVGCAVMFADRFPRAQPVRELPPGLKIMAEDIDHQVPDSINSNMNYCADEKKIDFAAHNN